LIEYKIMTNSIFDDYECPFDIIKYVASFNPETWFRIMRINDAFALYACTDAGKREYVRLFTLITYVNGMTQTSLFGIVHSIYDEPAIIHKDYKTWYINGLIDRNCDLPAYVCGLISSDCDLPPYVCGDYLFKKWYKNGKLHRDNDLPALIIYYPDGRNIWFRNGIPIQRY
jgi:hypothetical protein